MLLGMCRPSKRIYNKLMENLGGKWRELCVIGNIELKTKTVNKLRRVLLDVAVNLKSAKYRIEELEYPLP